MTTALLPRNRVFPSLETDQGVELSIVMPCLNEAETLETCIRKARAFLDRTGIVGEILIGDNGSTDGSQEIARSNGCRVVDVPLRGYGAALHYATLEARGKYIIMGDSDDSYDFTRLDPFVEKLRQGYDLVMGNRFAGGIRDGAMPWKNRYIGNPILTGIGRLFFRCPAKDFHCGLRGYSREGYARFDMRTTGMEFASEMVIKSTLLDLKMTEVPTTLDPDGRSRPPHLRPWRDGWRHLVFMLLYSPTWLFLLPGFFLSAGGLALLASLWSGPVFLGGLRLDVHTMFYAALMVMIGFQAIVFSLFSKVFAIQEGLLAPDPRLDRLMKVFTLELGGGIGALLVALGMVGSFRAVTQWGQASFGLLDPSTMLRLVIPSGIALTLGVQVILSSFFLRILALKTRRLV